MLFRSFAGNEYNHWLTEYEKDVKRNHMLVVHMFTILPGTAILNKSKVLWFTLGLIGSLHLGQPSLPDAGKS